MPVPVASVDEAFNALLRRVELNPARVALASQRYEAIKTVVERALPGKTLRQIGSFQRKTKIRPVDLTDRLDVDTVVNFGRFYNYAAPSAEGTTPNKALEIIRRAVWSSETYRVMPQKQDHPALRIEYADQMAFELVPAFEDLTGQHSHGVDGPNCFIVANSPYSWTPADYDYDAKVISTFNQFADERLVPSIKMVKTYFRNATVPLKSFHTEILVANAVPGIISEWKGKGYRFGYHHLLAAILAKLSSTVGTAAALPGSFSPSVDSGLNLGTLFALGPFFKARADAAWKLCSSNSIHGWREFFGEPFPS